MREFLKQRLPPNAHRLRLEEVIEPVYEALRMALDKKMMLFTYQAAGEFYDMLAYAYIIGGKYLLGNDLVRMTKALGGRYGVYTQTFEEALRKAYGNSDSFKNIGKTRLTMRSNLLYTSDEKVITFIKMHTRQIVAIEGNF